MVERNRLFAILPIHGKNLLVEGKDMDQLQQGIDKTLEQPEIDFPFHDFRSEIRAIEGREIQLPQGKGPGKG